MDPERLTQLETENARLGAEVDALRAERAAFVRVDDDRLALLLAVWAALGGAGLPADPNPEPSPPVSGHADLDALELARRVAAERDALRDALERADLLAGDLKRQLGEERRRADALLAELARLRDTAPFAPPGPAAFAGVLAGADGLPGMPPPRTVQKNPGVTPVTGDAATS